MQQLVLKMWPKIPWLALQILGPSGLSILGPFFSEDIFKRRFIISIFQAHQASSPLPSVRDDKGGPN